MEIRQGAPEKWIPEVYVRPNGAGNRDAVSRGLEAHIARLQAEFAGVAYERAGDELHVTIPDRYRVGHEAHFAQVLSQFLTYLGSPKSMPEWEKAGMIAKYTVSTSGS